MKRLPNGKSKAEREKWTKDCMLFFSKHVRSSEKESKLFNFGFRDEGADPVFMHPRGLAIRLYDNQKEFLTWASDQEKKRGGGIVADDTETGKTLEAISLVLDGRERDGVTCTLIVCQPDSVGHWIRELNRSLVPGNSKFFVYCEANREQKDLAEYDFVVTTYNIVEEEYRNSIIFKEFCHVCGERVHLAKLKRHAKICVKGKKSCGRKISEERMTVLHSIEWNRVILDEANAMAYRKSFGTN